MAGEDSAPFSFAVITDSHIKLEEGDHSSPYPSNQKSIARNKWVVRRLNELKPEFVIHLGDLVQPVPKLPTYGKAMQIARDILGELDMPIHVLPGNHDLGDKPAAFMAAPPVSDSDLEAYAPFWGPTYISFDRGKVHFVCLNSPVMNTGLPVEAEQQAWLEEDLKEATRQSKRILMFIHYPLYMARVDEEEHYDNIAEPARSWVLDLIRRHRVEAVYAGHVHNYFFHRYENANLFVLPAIAFVRQDYSELFRIGPADEYGRNDSAKLGFAMVTVTAEGVETEIVRSYGAEIDSEPAVAKTSDWLFERARRHPQGPKAGVYLRRAWAEPTIMPFGNLDEFCRKEVYNDYPLLAAQEAGLIWLRTPVGDLIRKENRERVHAYRSLGFRFNFFQFGLPDRRVLERIGEHAELIDLLEFIVAPDCGDEVLEEVRALKESHSIKVALSALDSSAHYDKSQGSKFNHFVGHGLKIGKEGAGGTSAFLKRFGSKDLINGFVFRIAPGEDSAGVIPQAASAARAAGAQALIHVRMQADESPAAVQHDDEVVAGRVTEALTAAFKEEGAIVLFDTFLDHDRGYHVRNGLLDRRCNPRSSFHALRKVHGKLLSGDHRNENA